MDQEINQFSVTIIGLGNIGMLYDYNNDSDVFLTHTKSAFYHKNFKIKYLIDIDPEKLKLAKKKYGIGIKYLSSIDSNYTPTDLIVLSADPETNVYHLNKLKSIEKVKLFLIEKPFLNRNLNISDFKKILNKTYINYYRKSLPFFRELRGNIQNHLFGDLININIRYSKGIKNNGSHLIDLVNFFFDSSYDKKSVKVINYINDYSSDDESITFSVNYKYNGKNIAAIFHALDERKFSLIEMDLIFEKKRFRIYDFGGKIEIYEPQEDIVFSGYKNLRSLKIEDTDINSYGLHTYELISHILNKREYNYSTLDDEFRIYDLSDHIIKKLKKFKRA
ncbi:MAG: hypothetical protein P8K14_02140 [Flavobacteriaceae bacterium]|jgi:predicted dehydrogenase|nr:hypothetical protein [Flavobacteriaceae bacterium]